MPDPKKVETIRRIKTPSVKEYVPNLANITAPLKVLLEKDAEWVWDHQHKQAMEKL